MILWIGGVTCQPINWNGAATSFLRSIYQADYELQIAHIQPNNPEGNDNIISFQEPWRIIRQHGDELSVRFSESLLGWCHFKPLRPY